jgi:hypothetical protein
MRKKLFSDMTMAPRDGSLIEVRHGPNQEIVLARWSGQAQAFVRDDDPDRKTLHRVTAWRAGAGREGGLTGVKAPEPAPAQPVAVPSRIVVARKPTRKR